MRILVLAALLASATAPAFAAEPAPVAAAATGYSVKTTDIGTLLDNAATKAIVEKHLPGFTTNEQIELARGLTLASLQEYAPDQVTDAALAAIEVDLAKVPVKTAG